MIDTDFQEPYQEYSGEPMFFTEFMAAYPKQENRHGALREWWKIRPSLEMHAKIMRGLKALKQMQKWAPPYWPSAAAFLRDRRWHDADDLPKEKPSTIIEAKVEREEFDTPTAVGPKAALRQGLIDGWLKQHPGEDPPRGLLEDPLRYVTSQVRSI